jgi:hypothetical protein
LNSKEISFMWTKRDLFYLQTQYVPRSEHSPPGLETTNQFFLFSTTHCSLLRLIVRSGLDVPTFVTRRLYARVPSGGRWNCGREMSGKFCLNADFRVKFKDLLHAVKLRHWTGGFTSSPKKGVLRIFCLKNPTASAGCEPANLGTKSQHAISRPPKTLQPISY